MKISEKQLKNIIRESIIETLYNDELNEGKLGRALGAAALGGALMFGHPQNANAQLNVKSQVRMEPQKMCNLGIGINMFKEDDGYRIKLQACGLESGERWQRQTHSVPGGSQALNVVAGFAMRSAEKQNGVGNGQYISLLLGDTEESAVQSLEQLYELVVQKVHKTEITQTDGDVTLINNTSAMYPDGLWVTQEGIDGYNELSIGAIKNALKFFGETYRLTDDDFQQEYADNEKEYLEYCKLKAYYKEAQREAKASTDPKYVEIKKQQMKKMKNLKKN